MTDFSARAWSNVIAGMEREISAIANRSPMGVAVGVEELDRLNKLRAAITSATAKLNEAGFYR